MVDTIGPFRGEWSFLSNFYPVTVLLDDVPYPSVEHAYQAARCELTSDREAVRDAVDAGEAKRLGRLAPQVVGWDERKENIMLKLLRQKFSRADLAERLSSTSGRRLIEVNSWGDSYWGTVDGVGLNRLGVLLELVRDEVERHRGSAVLDGIGDRG